jgi:hypothetical protein
MRPAKKSSSPKKISRPTGLDCNVGAMVIMV